MELEAILKRLRKPKRKPRSDVHHKFSLGPIAMGPYVLEKRFTAEYDDALTTALETHDALAKTVKSSNPLSSLQPLEAVNYRVRRKRVHAYRVRGTGDFGESYSITFEHVKDRLYQTKLRIEGEAGVVVEHASAHGYFERLRNAMHRNL